MSYANGRLIHDADSHLMELDDCLNGFFTPSLLPRFHELVGGDEVAQGKPAPDIYLEAARRLGAIAGTCLVLEDSEPGVRAALAAGMMPIMVPDSHPPSADLVAIELLVLPTLHEVLRHLAALPE